MDPLTVALISSLAGGAISAFSGDKKEKDRVVDTARPLTAQEKSALLTKIYKAIEEESATAEGGAVSGLERRGIAGAGQVAGLKSRIAGSKSRAKGQALSDVNLATRSQTFIPGREAESGVGGIGDLSQLLSFYLGQRGQGTTQQAKPNLMDIFADFN